MKAMAPGVFRLPDQRIRVRAQKRGYGKIEVTLAVDYLDDGRTRLASTRKMPDGRTEIVLPRNARLKQELISLREDLLSRLGEASGGSLKVQTFGEALELYRDAPKKNGERRRLVGAQGRFDWLMDNYGSVPIHGIHNALWRLRTEAEAGKLSWSPGTVNRYITMAKGAVTAAYKARDAYGERRLDVNVLEGFPTLMEDSVRYRILSAEERRRFWAHCPVMYRPLWYYASRTPARVSELINLTRRDVNHMGGMLAHLSASNAKGRFSRNLVFWPEFQGYVQSYLESPADHFFNQGPPDYAPFGYQSRVRGKRCMHTDWLNDTCRAAEIEGYNFHKTRQEAVMYLYQEGWSRPEIMLVGGWKAEASFDRYFNPELAAMIDKGIATLDTSWHQEFAADLEGWWESEFRVA